MRKRLLLQQCRHLLVAMIVLCGSVVPRCAPAQSWATKCDAGSAIWRDRTKAPPVSRIVEKTIDTPDGPKTAPATTQSSLLWQPGQKLVVQYLDRHSDTALHR